MGLEYGVCGCLAHLFNFEEFELGSVLKRGGMHMRSIHFEDELHLVSKESSVIGVVPGQVLAGPDLDMWRPWAVVPVEPPPQP